MFLLSFKFNKKYIFIGLLLVLLIGFAIFIYFNNKSSSDAKSFLISYGLDVEYLEEKPMFIPHEFPPFLNEYNNIQKKQGFDLSKYKGKQCSRVRFIIKNKKDDMFADVFLFGGKIIGGDIHYKIYGKQPQTFDSI